MSPTTARKNLILMYGPSGIGKSTYVNTHKQPGDIVCSADDYFIDSATGDYRFDPSRLAEAHAECRDKAFDAMNNGAPCIWIDNTNLKPHDASPYLELARLRGYNIILVLSPGLYPCAQVLTQRNTHGVPLATIQRQIHTMALFEQDWLNTMRGFDIQVRPLT